MSAVLFSLLKFFHAQTDFLSLCSRPFQSCTFSKHKLYTSSLSGCSTTFTPFHLDYLVSNRTTFFCADPLLRSQLRRSKSPHPLLWFLSSINARLNILSLSLALARKLSCCNDPPLPPSHIQICKIIPDRSMNRGVLTESLFQDVRHNETITRLTLYAQRDSCQDMHLRY